MEWMFKREKHFDQHPIAGLWVHEVSRMLLLNSIANKNHCVTRLSSRAPLLAFPHAVTPCFTRLVHVVTFKTSMRTIFQDCCSNAMFHKTSACSDFQNQYENHLSGLFQ
ncbi:hypothetical protein RRG08_013237 [Elysia crispata]|uniref:Uncharacterized protein n=1 Tax=Elysia crispata TaxID=231223 RepID=A0AAE1DA51_9GAST|nr:hypothetical protein RRG08_013237 [Elysia crispata]